MQELYPTRFIFGNSLETQHYKSMKSLLHEDETFENFDYTVAGIPEGEFENCEFIKCNFHERDLSNNDFLDCTFRNCNLSLVVVNNTGLKNIIFIDCKLSGVDFSKCKDFLFMVSFQNCQLDYCSFYGKKMKKTNFTECSLKNVDFAEVDLSMAVFKNCDLANAMFDHTMLEKADFRSATNYVLDPELNKIKKAKFSYPGLTGLLNKYNIDIE